MSLPIAWVWERGRWSLRFSWRSGGGVLGRFGGGWQWKVGAQWTSTTLLLSLLVCEFSIDRKANR